MKKKILYLILGLFVIAQFMKPEKIHKPLEPGMDISAGADVPTAVAQALKKGCYDCHSNQPEYPWYFAITPVNYYLNGHIEHASEHVNFSEWNGYSAEDKKHNKEEICEVLEKGEMPLWNYALMHKDRVLTEEEKALICQWANN